MPELVRQIGEKSKGIGKLDSATKEGVEGEKGIDLKTG